MSDLTNSSENYRVFLHFRKAESTIVILNNIFYLRHRVVFYLILNRDISKGITEESTSVTSITSKEFTSITSITSKESTSITSITSKETTSITSIASKETTSITSISNQETTRVTLQRGWFTNIAV